MCNKLNWTDTVCLVDKGLESKCSSGRMLPEITAEWLGGEEEEEEEERNNKSSLKWLLVIHDSIKGIHFFFLCKTINFLSTLSTKWNQLPLYNVKDFVIISYKRQRDMSSPSLD